MKTAAVICEFNPLHNGHKYLIDTIKSQHADCVVAIMSGNFVQRGDIAIADKYARTKMALQSGCDLVVELPTVFALSSAHSFAKGGVQITDALNVDMLCFGAEDADINALNEITDAFNDDIFKSKVKEYLNTGEYYPKAISKAMETLLSDKHCDILNKPNNILAIEYIKALKGTNVCPVAIKRTGAEHDSDKTCDNIASATHIRKLVLSNKPYDKFTDFEIKNHADISKLETAILYKLRCMSKEQIENLPDVSEGLHNRIFECAKISNSLEELYENLKTKRYTLARLRRIVLYALLDITKKDMQSSAQYIRILGLTDKGAAVLNGCDLPIIAKVARDYSLLNDEAKSQFDFDVKASEIYSLALNKKTDVLNDFKSQIIKI